MKWSLANRTLTIVFIFVSQFSLAQKHTGKEFHFPPVENLSNSSPLEYHARDHIKMGVGTHITPSAKQEFHAVIDEYLEFTPTNISSEVPSEVDYLQKEVDITLPIGKIAGQASVGADGSANYSIPIYTPPGTNGMEPQIALVYNSNSGNGVLGRGWNISGLSAITRMGKTFYHDGYKEGIKLTNEDRFVLNGQPLYVANWGPNGGHGTTYATEVESYSKITSYGSVGNGPQYFKVESKDGLTYYYGNYGNQTSNVKGDNLGTAVSWLLYRVEDLNGNAMIYHYRNTNHEARIQEISYTHNDSQGLNGYNSIKFFYDLRAKAMDAYPYGAEVPFKQAHSLREVQVESEGKVFKKYNFKYFTDIHPFLYEVIESDGMGQSINTTVFRYSKKGLLWETHNEESIDLSQKDIMPVDFNGDGRMDIFAANYQYSDGVKSHTYYEVYVNQEGGFVLKDQGALPEGFELRQFNLFKPNGAIRFANYSGPNAIQLDTDGDGRGEVLLVHRESPYRIKGFVLYKYNEAEEKIDKIEIDVNPEFVDIQPHFPWFSEIGDFNGDGRTDLVTFLYSKISPSTPALVFYDLSANTNQIIGNSQLYWEDIQPNVGFFTPSDTNRITFMQTTDINGNGKSDLLLVGKIGLRHYELNFDSNGDLAGYVTLPHQSIITHNAAGHLFEADFNLDGKSDFLDVMEGGFEYFRIRLSDGKTYHSQTLNGVEKRNRENCRIMDVNGDGFQDIIQPNMILGEIESYDYEPCIVGCSPDTIINGTNHTKIPINRYYTVVDIYYNNGVGEFIRKTDTITSQSSKHMPLFRFFTSDYNGDGSPDLYILGDKLQVWQSYNIENRPFLLAEIKDGWLHKSTFQYSTLNNKDVYDGGASVTYPLRRVDGNIIVVGCLSKEVPGEKPHRTRYFYRDALLHLQGKGFLGFTSFEQTSQNEIKTIARKQFNQSYFFPQSQIYQEVVDGGLIAQSVERIDYEVLWEKHLVLKPIDVRKNDYIKGTWVTTYFDSYDNWGNLTQSTTHQNGVSITTVVNEYDKKGTWIPSSLKSSRVTQQRGSHKPYVRETYYMSNSKGLVFRIITDPGKDKKTITNYSYDGFGNVISENLLYKGSTTYTYDSKGRFIVSATSPLGFTTKTKYHPFWGKPTTKTNIAGQETKFEYDSFGRLKKTTNHRGHTLTYNISYGGSNDPDGTFIKSWTTGPQLPVQISYLDSLGRLIFTKTETFSGDVWQESHYDGLGRDSATSEPYFSGTPLWNYIKYNSFQQVSEIEKLSPGPSLGALKSTFHYGLTTSVTGPDGKTVSKTEDGLGNIITSTDEGGGIVNFTYNSQNKPIVIEASGIKSYMRYDEYGNQVTLYDVNTDSVYYEYNAFGELIKQTNPQGEETVISYDEEGRVLTKTTPEGVTSYSYYTEGKGIGQIEKITAPNGLSILYEYDFWGQLIKTTEVVDNQSFVFEYSYDSFGKMTSKTYPSSYKVIYVYDETKGYLLSMVDDDGNVLWERLSENALGQTTKAKVLGEVVERTYDDYGMPDRIKSTPYYDWDFDFDPIKGNLTSRKDVIRGLSEHFAYGGSYDRLTSGRVTNSTTGNIFQSFAHSYAQNGNISTKDGMGMYNYDPDKKHALYEVVPYTEDAMVSPPAAEYQHITYNSFQSIEEITEGNYRQTFTYGFDEERRKSTLYTRLDVNAPWVPDRIRYYIGDHEVQINAANQATSIDYIAAPGLGLIAVHVQSALSEDLYTVATDYLGNIRMVIDEAGEVIEEYNYGAWGEYRNPETWGKLDEVENKILFRGYTGHEHMAEFGLINMNGRLYDPATCRMLSPDNYVQSPYNSQNYNRYTYVLNNPLKYTDPSGEFLFAITAFIIKGGVDLLSNNWQGWNGSGRPALMAGAMNLLNPFGGTNMEFLQFAGTKAFEQFSPSINVSVGGLSFSASPSIAFGEGISVGAEFGVSSHIGPISVGLGLNTGYTFKGAGSGNSGWATRSSLGFGYHSENFGLAFYSNQFNGLGTSQRVGGVSIRTGAWNFRYENDGYPFGKTLGDGNDSYRTAAASIGFKDFSIGFNLFTGKRGEQQFKQEEMLYGSKHGNSSLVGAYGERYPNNLVKEVGPKYRLGAAYFGYRNYRVGVNSDWIRHGIQNWGAHEYAKKQPGFIMTSDKVQYYFQYQTPNPFTLW